VRTRQPRDQSANRVVIHSSQPSGGEVASL
jgi:hypothetical protein